MGNAGRNPPSGPVNYLSGSVVHDFASVAAASVAVQGVTIAEVQVGDTVFLTPRADLSVAVGILPGYCLVAGTARIPVVNPSAGALDPASATFDYRILRG